MSEMQALEPGTYLSLDTLNESLKPIFMST